jgi:glucokinase
VLAAAAALSVVPKVAVIGVPAVLDPETGLASLGTNVSWERYNVRELLDRLLSIPYTLDNDVNLAAYGEAWRGAASGGVSAFSVLSIGTGVGGAAMVNGTLWRGAHHAAGELGYLTTGDVGRNGPLPWLEQLISGPAIRTRALASAASGADSTDADTPDVLAAAKSGDPTALAVVSDVLEHLARAIANLTSVLDPELVILDGGVGRALAPWIGELQGRIGELIPFAAKLVVSELLPTAPLVGAVERGLALLARYHPRVPVADGPGGSRG